MISTKFRAQPILRKKLKLWNTRPATIFSNCDRPRSLQIWSYSGLKFGENMTSTELFKELQVFVRLESQFGSQCGVKSVN
jgi:hypothetical protein